MRPRIRQGADFRVPKGAARVVERQVAAGPAAGSAYDRGQHPGASRGNPQPHASELQRADPDLQHTVGLGERSAAPPGSEPCLPGEALAPANLNYFCSKGRPRRAWHIARSLLAGKFGHGEVSEASRKRLRPWLPRSWGHLAHPPLGMWAQFCKLEELGPFPFVPGHLDPRTLPRLTHKAEC